MHAGRRMPGASTGALVVALVAAHSCSPTSPQPPASVPAATTTTTTTLAPVPSPPPPTPCDGERVRPAISITAPPTDTMVNERTLTIEARASDNKGVTKVEFLYHIDELRVSSRTLVMDPPVLIGTRNSPPYRIRWSVPEMCRAKVSLLAWAYDACDNVGEAEFVHVVVCN